MTRCEIEELVGITKELAKALKDCAARLDANELVNRPHDPANKYDQPAYDAAKDAYQKWFEFNNKMVAKSLNEKHVGEVMGVAQKLGIAPATNP